MIVSWKELLTESGIPREVWPETVEERAATASAHTADLPATGTMAVVTYPPETPVTVLDPATGNRQWNPELKDGLEIIYRAYRASWGKACAPKWSRASNSVQFERV